MATQGNSPEELLARIRELEAQLAQHQQIRTPATGYRGLPSHARDMLATSRLLDSSNDPALPISPQTEFNRILQQTSRTACFSWQRGSHGVVYSPSSAEVLGYPAHMANRDFIRDHLIEADRDRIRRCFKRCITEGADYETELQALAYQPGSAELVPRWFQLRVRVVSRGADGQADYLIGTVTDIDKVKREQLAQAELARTENWLHRTLQQLLEDDSWDNIQLALKGLAEEFGTERCTLRWFDPKLRRMSITCHWSVYPDEKHDDPVAIEPFDQFPRLQALMSQRQPLVLDRAGLDSLDADVASTFRRYRVGSAVLIPIYYQDRLDGMLTLPFAGEHHRWPQHTLDAAAIIADALARAVSRHRITQELRESDQRYSHALRASKDGLWDWDIRTNALFFSPSYVQMLGYEEHELEPSVRTLIKTLMYPEDIPLLHKIAAQARSNPDQPVYSEYRMLHKDGHIVWVYSRAIVVDCDDRGNPVRAVGINADVTQFKHAQAELRQAQMEAVAANQTKTEFLTRMSHEIRTPLNAIIGMGHLLGDTPLDATQHSYLGTINASARSLLHTIDEILDFSKLESGTHLLENRHIDLEQVFDQLRRTIAVQAEAKGLELCFNTDRRAPRFVKGDTRRLTQILNNLLDNAVKFTERGKIELITRLRGQTAQGAELEFIVADTGMGIAPDRLQSMFDPFTQADGSTSRRAGGTGLGLTICHYLINQMGGKLEVRSEFGAGSQFSFCIRFERSQLGEQPLPQHPEHFHQLRTLIVDDNPGALTILENTARTLQLHTETATHAADAIARLRDAELRGDPFRLLLIDFQMPDINGAEACNLIRESVDIRHKPRMILVSNYSQQDIASRYPLEHTHGFISTPVSPSQLFDAIVTAFGEDLPEPPSVLTAAEVDQRLQGTHVLLAEDNLVNQKVAAAMLKKKGVRITVANNGQEVLHTLQQHPERTFDAILMDMEMPEMDGYEATRRIRSGQCCPRIPIIALTAHALVEDRQRCLDSGLDDYLTKPISPQLLYQTLAHFLADHIAV